MARRGVHAWDGKRRERGSARTRIMLFPAAIFFVAGLGGTPMQMLGGIAATLCIVAASWLTREGIRAEQAYDARRVARRPAIPRKIFGAVLTGLGVAAAAPNPLAFGLAAAGLHLLSFGPDPLRDKGTVDEFQSARVARAVDEGEAHLTQMLDAVRTLGDRAVTARVERFTATARSLFRQVEDDPRDLTAARKYMGVYLMGARDATVKFASLYAQRRDPAIRADFDALLADLETTFAHRSTVLLAGDRADLDLEISVLRDRLLRDTPLTER